MVPSRSFPAYLLNHACHGDTIWQQPDTKVSAAAPSCIPSSQTKIGSPPMKTCMIVASLLLACVLSACSSNVATPNTDGATVSFEQAVEQAVQATLTALAPIGDEQPSEAIIQATPAPISVSNLPGSMVEAMGQVCGVVACDIRSYQQAQTTTDPWGDQRDEIWCVTYYQEGFRQHQFWLRNMLAWRNVPVPEDFFLTVGCTNYWEGFDPE